MNMCDIRSILDNPLILTEGAIIERLTHEFKIILDSGLLNASLVSDTKTQNVLKKIYKEYIDVAVKFGLPILVFTPTWKVNSESCKKNEKVLALTIKDCCEFMFHLKNEYCDYDKIYIGGLMGVLNDSYKPLLSLNEDDSYNLHKETVKQFYTNKEYINFLIASTLPGLSESLGIAKTMSESKIPYILSFVMRNDGKILDGSLLTDVIKQIDSNVENAPMCYMINCVHPQNALIGLNVLSNDIPNDTKKYLSRIKGIQGNTSKLSPEELDGSFETYKEDPIIFANEMYKLKKKYNLTILGGCCGTDKNHIYSIASVCP